MPSVSIIAAALTDHGPHSYSLWVAGLDVTKQPGATAGSQFGTLVDTVTVTPGGPSGNGSMEFLLDDPTNTGSIPTLQLQGDESVLFWDHIRDVPLFKGTVDSVTESMPEGVNHRYHVRCTDLNAVLDRTLIPAYTLGAGSAQQQILSIMQYVPLRAFGSLSGDAAAVRDGGSQEKPVGMAGATATTISGQVMPMQTARAAINAVLERWTGRVGYLLPGTAQCFVDQYGGLRLYDSFVAITPSDYRQTQVIVSSGAVTEPGQVRPDDMEITADLSGAVTAVYITGGTAEGTGWYGWLGSRREAMYSQADSDTAERLQAYGQAYLTAFGTQYRASFGLSARTTPFVILPGDYVTVPQGTMGGMAGYVQSVSWTFTGGGAVRDTQVTVGSLAASLARTLR